MLFLIWIIILLYFFLAGRERVYDSLHLCHTPPLRERKSRERTESRHLEIRPQAEAMETHSSLACSSSLAQCAASYPGLSLPAMGWSLLCQLYLSWKCPTDLSTGRYYINVFLTEIHSIDNSTLCPVDKKLTRTYWMLSTVEHYGEFLGKHMKGKW